MLRWVLMIAILVAASLLAWEFVPLQVTIWDGGYELAVHVSATAGPLRSVSCEAFSRAEDAQHALEYTLPPETSTWSATADPFTGEVLKVRVPVSGRDSPCGRELRRFQFRYLLVIGHLQNGRRVGKVVEIPDGRVSREITVVLP
jgi:hypothetical protein